MDKIMYEIKPIGFIQSKLTRREAAPRQGYEGAPDAWIESSSQGRYNRTKGGG